MNVASVRSWAVMLSGLCFLATDARGDDSVVDEIFNNSQPTIQQVFFEGEDDDDPDPNEAPAFIPSPSINPRFYVDYDRGLVFRPIDQKETPFELKVRIRLQSRYSAFSRDIKTYSNQGDADRGGPLFIENRNYFEIERSRIMFSGYVINPQTKYYISIDANTDNENQLQLWDFWLYREFTEEFRIYTGKGMVPGSRDWLNTSPRTHLADRSMATTFFRPGRSLGVWARGRMRNEFYYRIFIGNGMRSGNRAPSELDNHFMGAMTSWWEPWGDYGRGYADLANHDCPVIRLGHSFTYAKQSGKTDGSTNDEQLYVRLSDGTRLITPGALAPGVTVNAFDTYLYSIDAALKYAGFSSNTEVFLRWLTEFGTVGGAVPHSELMDRGFVTDVGYFVIPQRWEAVGRISHVDGFYGGSWEYAAGINYYVNGSHFNKFTFDVSVLDGSPAENGNANYFVGQDGVMFRFQYQVQF